MSRHSSWRPDIARARAKLDALPPRTVILDQHGHAWQSGGYGYWYRAFDAEGISEGELAQRVGTITVVTGEAIT